MTPLNHSRRASLVARRTTILVTIVVLAGALGLTGCSIIKATHKLLHGVAAVKSLTSKVKTGDLTHYEVTYVTTGSPPTTIEYADAPPHDFAFDTTVGGHGVRFIQSSAGAFACNQSSSSASGSPSGWSCLQLKGTALDPYRATYALYTGAYWIAFLKVYSTVAGLAGVSINSTNMTVDGFKLQCVVITGKKSTATSKWCVTSQGILGYVSVSSHGSAFEIKSYSPSPPSSLFKLPAGATVTTIPAGTS
ncbi:MAG: hypothetical protein ACLQCU_12060 [Acidimicrobiales bacterium]|jgi:hypothetical protein